MTGRSQLGWAIPEDEWERFVSYVVEKWGSEGSNIRYELERAMEEFLDLDDELGEAERLLREAHDLQRASSSIETVLTRDVDSADKRQVGYRVREPLKTRFQRFVSEEFNSGVSGRFGGLTSSHVSYGQALAAALREYRTGGVSRRIRELVEATITGATGSGRETEAVENEDTGMAELSTASDASTTAEENGSDTDTARVEADAVIAIADDLSNGFPEKKLRKSVVKELNARDTEITENLIDKYCDAVLDQLPVVESPRKEGEYIPETVRERMTAWEDLDKVDRAARLRRLIVVDAIERGNTHQKVTYRDVIDLFDEDLGYEPSHQYAYDLMDEAADGVEGFRYGDAETKLRVNLTDVHSEILDWAREERGLDPCAVGVSADITSYTAGSTPQQEGAADD